VELKAAKEEAERRKRGSENRLRQEQAQAERAMKVNERYEKRTELQLPKRRQKRHLALKRSESTSTARDLLAGGIKVNKNQEVTPVRVENGPHFEGRTRNHKPELVPSLTFVLKLDFDPKAKRIV